MRLADYFDAAASLHPRNVAFVQDEQRIDFAQVQRLVHATAHALVAEEGLPPRAHVAIYSPNDYRVSLLQIAANRAGMVWVSVHTRNSIETNLAVMAYADCDAVFFHSAFADIVPAMKARLPRVRRFICIDAPSAYGPCLSDWIAPWSWPFMALPEQAAMPAMLQPTGGTTGPSKGAVHTNRSLEMALISVFETLRFDAASRVLAVAPLTHAACMLTLACATRGGRTVVLDGFEAGKVLECIEREGITHLFLPPTLVYALLDDPRLGATNVSSLRCVAVGAAPIAPEKVKEAVRRFGPVIYEVFGQSECLFPVVAKRPEDYLLTDGSFDEVALASAGRAVPFARVEILNEDGSLAGPGVKGEIVVQSTMVMQGYYRKPEETAEVSTGDWHRTTDVGVKDERGFITIVDRKKDMIVSGGFNVFPSEIEAVILSHPAVLDCAVIGVPDRKWGEAVKAIVQLKPSYREASESIDVMLTQLCKDALGSVKAPKSIEFWPELPRSAVGKVLKRDIRARFWEGQWRAV